MIFLVLVWAAIACYAVALPRRVANMTEEEYRQYFCHEIMGMK